MTFYTPRVELSPLILEFNMVSKRRKELRKTAARVLKKNATLIRDRNIKRKIQGGYFKDLVDSKVLVALEDLYNQ